MRVQTVDTRTSSPFAASLLFGYVANYLYDGDAPLAERRAHALSVDQSQLAELIGEGELRALLDPEALAAIERDVQHLPEKYHARSTDAVHDLLLRLGDLSPEEIAARSLPGVAEAAIPALVATRRALPLRIGGTQRLVAVEDAARYRDGLGTPLPPGLPASLLEPAPDAIADLLRRYARTHGPFTPAEAAARFAVGPAVVEQTLRRLAETGRVVEGEFRPGGRGREWCDADVLRSLRRRSLAALRQDVEPVEPPVLGRFLAGWHGLTAPRSGLDALLDVIEQLQGAPLVASVLEREVLPARVAGYTPAQLDTLVSAGEVIWVGVEPLGERDGRIALYLTDQRAALMPPRPDTAGLAEREAHIVAFLTRHGAAFFGPLHDAVGGGFPQETVDALWSLVWKGLVTNDTLHPLRAYSAPAERARRDSRAHRFRSRRLVPPSAEGRWSALDATAQVSPTAWATALTRQLLARHGVVTREVTALEPLAGGFSMVYPVLRRLEDTGRVRRGYFVAGLGGAQFAEPGAIDRLRAERDPATRGPGGDAGGHRSRPTPTERWSSGRRGWAPRRCAPAASPARASCSSTATPRPGSPAASASCSWPCPRRSPNAAAVAAPWPVSWCASRSSRRPNGAAGSSPNSTARRPPPVLSPHTSSRRASRRRAAACSCG